MNKATLILIGIFAAFSLSWFGMVWGPAAQQAALAPVESAGEIYPHDRVGEAKQGAQVYRAQGCYQCHSQQVRQGKVLYEIQLTGLGDKLQDLKDMMQRNDLEYLKFKEPIESAYQFKGEAFAQWFENYSKGLATVEAASAALQKGTSEEAKKAAAELADAGAYIEKLCRLAHSSEGQNSVVSRLSNVIIALTSLGDPPAVLAFSGGIGFISTSATTEAVAYFKLRDGVDKGSRQVVARLSGLLTKNETAALAFFQLSSNEKASLSLLGDEHLIWSSTKTDQDAKRLLAAIKGEGVGATANTRAHAADGAGPLWADVQRGWGVRRSVPLDYLYDDIVMLGSRRMGPDLAHVGGRLIEKARDAIEAPLKKDGKAIPAAGELHRQAVARARQGLFQHLYQPRSVVEKSVMPPFTHLFERRSVGHAKVEKELVANHPDGFFIEEGERRYFVTPKPAARVLVAYLLSLNQKDLVPEAPTPAMKRAEKTDPQ